MAIKQLNNIINKHERKKEDQKAQLDKKKNEER